MASRRRHPCRWQRHGSRRRRCAALDGRGSGIVLQPDTVRWFTERSTQDVAALSTSTSYVQYLDRTSWGTFYRALLADFGTEHYHYGEYACGFDQFDDHATVRFVSGRVESAHLVVFADGVTSVVRERFDADAGLRYSGYIGWRGTLPVRDLDGKTREVLQDAITYDVVPNSHITVYPIPGENGLGLDDQLMNYVWYRNVPAGPELTEMCIDKRGIPGSVSVHPGQVQDRYVAEMKRGTQPNCWHLRLPRWSPPRRRRICRWLPMPGLRGWPWAGSR
ncbi:MAG: Monooxygenase [Mycobacterium sp.]|nr:Monooxygenase [Mycobacterium sp.]